MIEIKRPHLSKAISTNCTNKSLNCFQHVQAVSTYGPSPSAQSDFPEESDISQFHTQDGEGRAVFGYNTPDQVRIEARTPDGKVRGSYSYLDPFGRTIKVLLVCFYRYQEQ